jgi:O-antigen/teichoic acid export membrane protein
MREGRCFIAYTISHRRNGRDPASIHWKCTVMPATKVEDAEVVDGSTLGGRPSDAAVASALKTAKQWKAAIGFAFLDQGMTSCANFALFIIAARVTPIDEFGNYSIAWAFSMLVVFAATALLVDPLPAITSIRRPSARRSLLAAAVRLSMVTGCALAALLATSGLIVQTWSPTYAGLLLCLAVTSPLQFLQSTSRRLSYLLRREGVAAAAAAAYAAALIIGIGALWAADLFSASGLLLLSGAASLVASVAGLAGGCVPLSKVRPPLRKWLMKKCWHSGKWLAGAVVVTSMSNFLILSITAVIFGPAASGILRAVSVLFMPIYQAASAMGSLLIPRVAEIGASRSASRLRTISLQTIAGLATLATVYSAVILTFGRDLFVLVYKKTEIVAASGWLWPFSICAVLDAVIAAMAIVLVAIAVTQFNFWARVASTVALVIGTLCLGPTIGLEAVAWVITVGSAASALILGFALITAIRRRSFTRMQGVLVGPVIGGCRT